MIAYLFVTFFTSSLFYRFINGNAETMFGPTLFENISETVLKEADIMNIGYKIGINVCEEYFGVFF